MVFDTLVRKAKTMGLGPDALYMGFDLSTQQLKCLVVDSELKLRHEAKVDFDADLAKYGIEKGVLTNPAVGEVYAPTAMWLEAVDLVLQRLKDAGLEFSKVRGVSGAGMQHGTVFWSRDAEPTMQRLDSSKSLMEQMPTAFAHPNSPNWQDASTQEQCEEFDAQLGSKETLADVTGSKAHHRFSGPQILRYRTKYPQDYEKTTRISLVSSFLCSVFLGKIAPIDISDVTGMNLWDVHAGDWNEKLLQLTAGSEDTSDIRQKLGQVYEDGGDAFGSISSYFVSRYGFPQDCQIIPFTGDNPSTILALPLRASDAMVSLGTSTTFLMSTPEYIPDPAYHFMNHPTTPGLYMFMLCYKNGGLAREHIRDELNDNTPTKDWSQFNETALSTPPLSQTSPTDPMRLGLYFPRPEIVPNLHAGHWRFAYDANASSTSPQALKELPTTFTPDDARNIVESQFLSLRLRSQKLVHSTPDPTTGKPLPPQPRRVYLVGGGSANPAIARLCAEVLGSAEGVYKLDIGGNACGLGAAYKAVWGCERSPGEKFEELIGKRWDEESFVKKVADGYQEGLWERYGEATKGFEAVERFVLEREGEGERQAEWKDGGGVLYDGREGLNGKARKGIERG